MLGCARDIRDLEREGGAIKKKVAVVDKYNHPPGKFEEKATNKIGRELGVDVCDCCLGTCCAAMRYLIRSLVDIGELKPNMKVGGGYFYSLIYVVKLHCHILHTVTMTKVV